MSDFIVSFGIPLAYIALGIAVLSAIAFPIMYMIQDFKKAKGALIGVGILAVVFVVCYFLAGGQYTGKFDISVGQMKIIEAAIYLFYILLSAAVIAIIYSSVSRYFK